MHIAICDDEQRELSYIHELVKEYDACIDVSLFLSADNLLVNIKKQHCDIVLLDIKMDGLDGFTAAKKIVAMKNPPLIIFITNSGEYTFRGYEVAFRYLPKPISFSVLSGVLSAAIAKITPYKISINVNGCSHIIPIHEIIYFESFGHSLVVHTKENRYDSRMKLSEVESMLPENIFAMPHKGYLVNLDYVSITGDNDLSLIGEIKIPISRRRKQEFEHALFRFVRMQ